MCNHTSDSSKSAMACNFSVVLAVIIAVASNYIHILFDKVFFCYVLIKHSASYSLVGVLSLREAQAAHSRRDLHLLGKTSY